MEAREEAFWRGGEAGRGRVSALDAWTVCILSCYSPATPICRYMTLHKWGSLMKVEGVAKDGCWQKESLLAGLGPGVARRGAWGASSGQITARELAGGRRLCLRTWPVMGSSRCLSRECVPCQGATGGLRSDLQVHAFIFYPANWRWCLAKSGCST